MQFHRFYSDIVKIHTLPVRRCLCFLTFVEGTQSTRHLYASPGIISASIFFSGMILSSPDNSAVGLSSDGKSSSLSDT